MSAANSSAMPVKNQAFRLTLRVSSSTTGNPITGGLTSIVGTVSLDGGAFASLGTAPTEIGTTGYVTVDLSAAEMNANDIVVQVTVGNASAIYPAKEIVPIDLSEITIRADGQTVKRFEQYWVQMWSRWWNRRIQNQVSGIFTLFKKDNITAWFTGSNDNSNPDQSDIGGVG